MYKFSEDECSIAVKWSEYSNKKRWDAKMKLPCYATEATESVQTSWSPQTVIGRTGSIFAYTGTSDTSVSFQFELHMEYYGVIYGAEFENYSNATAKTEAMWKEFNALITLIKSTCYPKYGQDLLKPPKTRFVFGNFRIDGKVEQVSVTWKTPVIDKQYAVANVSVQMSSVSSKILDRSDIICVDEAVRGLDY